MQPDATPRASKQSVVVEPPRTSAASPREATDTDLPRLFPVQDDDTPDYPAALRRAERAGRTRWEVGLALSGGGIRSATFSLGFVQGLAKLNLLGYVDYLSTVSGGGYFGSFLGRLFCRDELDELASKARPYEGGAPRSSSGSPARVASVQRILSDSASGPVRFLRENGRYLTPGGHGNALLGVAVALRNWVSVQIVMVVTGLAAVCLFELAAYSLYLQMPGWTLRLRLEQFWVNPLFAGLLVLSILFVVACGWGYWLVPVTPSNRGFAGTIVRAATVLVVGLGAFRLAHGPGSYTAAASALGTISFLTFLVFVLVVALSLLRAGSGSAPEGKEYGALQLARTTYTHWLTGGLEALLILLLVCAVDAAGMALLRAPSVKAAAVSVYATALAVVMALRPALEFIVRRKNTRETFKLPLGIISGAIGIAVVFAVLTIMSAFAHYVLWSPQLDALRANPLTWAYANLPTSLASLFWTTVVLIALSFAVGWTRAFVNGSSLYSTYETRIRRAYLGASNPERLRSDPAVSLAESHPNDSIPMPDYHPEVAGGPVHLINVTVNETIDGRSQVEQRDRRGFGLAIGPGGASAGVSHHAVWGHAMGAAPPREDPTASSWYRVFPRPVIPERLGLSQWVAVSGAAFSTGLGSRTSLGFSLLAGMANVRLGYWWDTHIEPGWRSGVTRRPLTRVIGGFLHSAFPVQGSLFDEWLAQFHGANLRYWYLTDGGHFENAALYELIRRRLPVIVACDNGADPEYQFEDIGNIVRKARIDFGAEIDFLTSAELARLNLDPDVVGRFAALDELRGREQGELANRGKAYAALARIAYAVPRNRGQAAPAGGNSAGETGWLIVIKPNLVEDEPADVLDYRAAHPEFPQETTLDQWFDEAQWESYRELGEHIAHRVFGAGAAPGQWTPAQEMEKPGSLNQVAWPTAGA